MKDKELRKIVNETMSNLISKVDKDILLQSRIAVLETKLERLQEYLGIEYILPENIKSYYQKKKRK